MIRQLSGNASEGILYEFLEESITHFSVLFFKFSCPRVRVYGPRFGALFDLLNPQHDKGAPQCCQRSHRPHLDVAIERQVQWVPLAS